MPELTGEIVGNYRLVRLLGKGGMGYVYEAKHTLIGRRSAVKVLYAELADDANLVQRMLREARAATAIGHPNIVDVLDFGRTAVGVPYLVMEYLEGQSLADYLDLKTRLDVQLSVAITLQVLSALVAAHRKGIVHRDLKPENIFLARSPHGGEEVKVLDFGLSKLIGNEARRERLTLTGMVMGTPYYMSPEQVCTPQDVDARTDLWATGVILYEAIAGHVPFLEKNYHKLLQAITNLPVPPLSTSRRAIPLILEETVSRALEKDPDDRFQRAADMIDALLPLYDRQLAEAGRFVFMPTLFEGQRDKDTADAETLAAGRPHFDAAPVASRLLEDDSLTEQDTEPYKRVSDPAPSAASAGGDAAQRDTEGTLVDLHLRRAGGRGWGRWVLIIGTAVFAGVGLALIPILAHQRELSHRQSDDIGVLRDAEPAQAAVIAEPRRPVSTEPTRLKVVLVGLPVGATVLLDGLPTTSPLLLDGDGAAHVLRVEAPGFKPFQQTFSARADLQRLRITMTPAPMRLTPMSGGAAKRRLRPGRRRLLPVIRRLPMKTEDPAQ